MNELRKSLYEKLLRITLMTAGGISEFHRILQNFLYLAANVLLCRMLNRSF